MDNLWKAGSARMARQRLADSQGGEEWGIRRNINRPGSQADNPWQVDVGIKGEQNLSNCYENRASNLDPVSHL